MCNLKGGSNSPAQKGLKRSSCTLGSGRVAEKAQASPAHGRGRGLSALAKNLGERILVGELVEFTELPPAKGKIKGLPHSVKGQIVVVQAADLSDKRKMVPGIATWVQCFSISISVVTSEAPDTTRSMLAYPAMNAKCSLRYR